MYADLSFGLEKESGCLPKLESIFGKLEHTKGLFSLWDYENTNVIIEIKSRRVSKNHYPTTIISQKKIDAMLKDPRESYAIFNFTDGLWGYPIDEESLQYCCVADGGRSDRGSFELNSYCYIPTDKLVNIEKKNN